MQWDEFDEQSEFAASEREIEDIDERRRRDGERERHLPMPLHIYGESEGDHLLRGARTWQEPPDDAPQGEEGGTKYTPIQDE